MEWQNSLTKRLIWMNLKVKLYPKRVVQVESVWLAIRFAVVPLNFRLAYWNTMEWPWASFWCLAFLYCSASVINGYHFSILCAACNCLRWEKYWYRSGGSLFGGNLWMKNSLKYRISPWLLMVARHNESKIAECMFDATIGKKQWEIKPQMDRCSYISYQG